MTTIYYVRHAQPNHENHNDLTRELTAKGLEDRKIVTEYLRNKQIDVVLSSPYKRAIDTVIPIAQERNLTIQTVDDFRERKIDNGWIEDFLGFTRRQWEDFSYKLSDGESLGEVQQRNIRALRIVLKEYEGKNVVIGGHGTALSTIINYYDKSFGFEQFCAMKARMPWVVKFVFSGEVLLELELTDIFQS